MMHGQRHIKLCRSCAEYSHVSFAFHVDIRTHFFLLNLTDSLDICLGLITLKFDSDERDQLVVIDIYAYNSYFDIRHIDPWTVTSKYLRTAYSFSVRFDLNTLKMFIFSHSYSLSLSLSLSLYMYIYIYIYIYIYRVSQEECARLREDAPYVKVYRYTPKHLYPKLNGYGDNGKRKVWSSGGSTHCTCQLTTLFMSVLECGVILRKFSSRSLQTIYVLPSW